MPEQFSRTELLLGQEGMDKLRSARVAVFGIGGVGGYAAEALARAGVGRLDLIDHDKVSISNINRQIIATFDTIGMDKVDVMKKRVLSINPDAEVAVCKCFYLPENADAFDLGRYSYVVDAIDTVTAKLELIVRAGEAGTPIISCMGTGNKLDPTRLEIADIYQTSVCPLAKVMRRELRKRNVEKLKVLYSKEEPIRNYVSVQGRAVPGSVSFVPPAAGLIIASEIVKEISGIYSQPKSP
ncbi:MAG: tRNA threonylcarbamoyladenosine dehydratase [Blautia sp.]|nr:tRNA threonylcarbamoyladenosine dehydratase [Blautia sp.]MCM1202368.1 tRNA threonylcarbamoyladenosine dehydratase [Bacteroides fragilis]